MFTFSLLNLELQEMGNKIFSGLVFPAFSWFRDTLRLCEVMINMCTCIYIVTLTLSLPLTAKLPYTNSLNPNETLSSKLFDILTTFSPTLSNIEADEKLSRLQFIYRAKG